MGFSSNNSCSVQKVKAKVFYTQQINKTLVIRIEAETPRNHFQIALKIRNSQSKNAEWDCTAALLLIIQMAEYEPSKCAQENLEC